MLKVLLTAATTIFLVLFGFQNSDYVPVSFVVGSPMQVRLIILLFLAAIFGFLFSYIRGVKREIKLKREIRRLGRLNLSNGSKRSSDHIGETVQE